MNTKSQLNSKRFQTKLETQFQTKLDFKGGEIFG